MPLDVNSVKSFVAEAVSIPKAAVESIWDPGARESIKAIPKALTSENLSTASKIAVVAGVAVTVIVIVKVAGYVKEEVL